MNIYSVLIGCIIGVFARVIIIPLLYKSTDKNTGRWEIFFLLFFCTGFLFFLRYNVIYDSLVTFQQADLRANSSLFAFLSFGAAELIRDRFFSGIKDKGDFSFLGLWFFIVVIISIFLSLAFLYLFHESIVPEGKASGKQTHYTSFEEILEEEEKEDEEGAKEEKKEAKKKIKKMVP